MGGKESHRLNKGEGAEGPGVWRQGRSPSAVRGPVEVRQTGGGQTARAGAGDIGPQSGGLKAGQSGGKARVSCGTYRGR